MSDSVSTKWDPRFRRKLIALGVIVVISALVGGGYAPLVGGTTGESLSQKDILVFGAHGMLVGLFFSTFELFYVQGSPGQWLRRMPFAKALLARSVLNTVVIVSAFVIGGLTMVPERFTDAGAMESFLRDVAFSFVIALTFQFILTVRQVIGGRVLWNLILGRYHRPVKEDRIFMFLDMVGSMVVADKMGVDIYEVIDAAATKPFGFVPYYPGPGLGGHCIPIDPFYLTWKAREYDINTRFIELAGEVNSNMPYWVLNKVVDSLNDHGKSLKEAKILIFN